MKVAVIDYNAGNVRSVLHALARLEVEAVLTADPDEIRGADKVIFPGVGEASSAMKYLRERKLDALIPSLTQPVLGICLGMQLLFDASEEGQTKGLGILPGKVTQMPNASATGERFKVPHVGWNAIRDLSGPLFAGMNENEPVYFVHGFYVESSSQAVATCDYVTPFCAAAQQKNFYATQFHPEKSGTIGRRILTNFLAI